jgi:hypothetical protein
MNTAILPDRSDAINPAIMQSIERLFRRAMSYRREAPAT